MCSIRSSTSRRSMTVRGFGRVTSTTVAVRQPPRGASGPAVPMSSVTLVPLLEPRVAAVVVAVLLPEARLVAAQQGQAGDPLGALPEVEVRHEQPHRPAVLDRQRTAVVLPDHPGLAAGYVVDGQVRGVAGHRRRRHGPGRGLWP